MPPLRFFWLFFAFLLVSPRVDAQTWTRFRWESARLNGHIYPKAAISIPVTLAGLPGHYWMQLDTGTYHTVLYGVTYRHWLEKQKVSLFPQTPENAVSLNAQIGSLSLKDFKFQVMPSFGDASDNALIGTVGEDLLETHILLLDMAHSQFSFLPSDAPLPGNLAGKAQFFPVSLRNHKILLPVSYAGKPLEPPLFFDTGSSLLPLSVTPRLWQTLTGRTGAEADNTRLTISSWGKPIEMIVTKTKEAVQVGGVNIGRVMAFHTLSKEPSVDFDKYPFKTGGLIGNAPFAEKYMVVFDLPHQRMALIESPSLHQH